MTQEKKLGRRLEDFSHLFLSSNPKESSPALPDKQSNECQDKSAGVPARSICITSDVKVVERAFITVHLALEIARRGKKVLVCDADFNLPRLCMLMGIPAAGLLMHLVSDNGEKKAVPETLSGIKLITLDVDVSNLSALSKAERSSFIQCLKSAEREAEIMLTSVSPRFMHHMMPIVRASTETMVIIPQQMAEMINGYGVVKAVFQADPGARVGIVSSRINAMDQADRVFEKMQKVVRKFLDKPLSNYGYVLDDNEITQSITKRAPLSVTSPDSKSVECIAGITGAILDAGGPAGEERKVRGDSVSFAEKLFGEGE